MVVSEFELLHLRMNGILLAKVETPDSIIPKGAANADIPASIAKFI